MLFYIFTHGIYQCENKIKIVNELINNLSTVSYLIIYSLLIYLKKIIINTSYIRYVYVW